MFDALVMGGASLLGGMMGSDAASDAAAGQMRAAEMATEEQRRQFDLLRQDNAPFLQTGQMANIRLRELLGLGGGGSAAPRSVDQIMAELRNSGRFSTPGQLQRGEEILAEGGGGGYRFYDPSDPQSYFRSEPNEYRMGPASVDEEALKAEAQRLYEQSLSSGTPGNVGELMKNFTGADLVNEPGFKFGLDQGNKAIENAARARGMSMSPATVKELLRYGNDYAGTKYGEAFNRDMSNRTTKYNFLTGTSGGGQQAAQTVGSAGMNMANNVGQLVTGAANARGAAGIAGANAFAGGINNAINNYSQKNLLDRILNKGGVGGGSGSTPWDTPNYLSTVGYGY
jgi:hypothetical protein